MARSRLPPGFRFHPTDEELLVHYLKKKVAGKIEDSGVIGEIDIYKFEPTDLPGLAILCSRDPEWFFFNAQDKKYLHRSRTNRTTKAGYWKATGKDRRIAVGSCSGMKKTLIYYLGRAPRGERTDWIMHEYRLDEEIEKKMNSPKSFVLCRVRQKSGVGPRNGEQYGAPVLDEEVEEYEDNDSVDDQNVLASALCNKSVMEKQVQDTPTTARVIEDMRKGAEDEFDSFLQSFLFFEEPEQHQAQEIMVDSLLGLLNDQSDFALAEPMHTASTVLPDNNSSSMDDFSSLLHPSDNEAVILEDMLHQVSGQPEVLPESPSGMQEPSHNSIPFHMDNVQSVGVAESVGFVELADLEDPSHEQSSLDLAYYERLLLELDNGREFPVSSSFGQGELQRQQGLQDFCDREGMRGWQHFEASGMGNELEVPLGSFQGLSVLGSSYTRLSTGDDEVGSSGSPLISDREELDLSLSHSNGVYGHPEGQLGDVRSYAGDASSSPDSTSEVESEVGHEELVSNPVLSVMLPNDHSNSAINSAPSSSSPSSLVRIISGFLGKVNALPASAAELPVELKRCQALEEERSAHFAADNNAGALMITQPSASSINGSSVHLRAKVDSSQEVKQSTQKLELELQWSMASIAVLNEGSRRSCCRSFTNGLSIILFWIATSSLILFCMIRGFCRSTRMAFT